MFKLSLLLLLLLLLLLFQSLRHAYSQNSVSSPISKSSHQVIWASSLTTFCKINFYIHVCSAHSATLHTGEGRRGERGGRPMYTGRSDRNADLLNCKQYQFGYPGQRFPEIRALNMTACVCTRTRCSDTAARRQRAVRAPRGQARWKTVRLYHWVDHREVRPRTCTTFTRFYTRSEELLRFTCK